MLQVRDVHCRIDGKAVIEGATFAVAEGHRAALVGRNGAGKSTLLRLIAGEIECDSGAVELPRGARVSHVAQTAPSGAASVREFVLAADRERARLLAEAADGADGARLAEVHARLDEIAAHAAPARAAAILRGLGFDPRAQEAPLDSQSGGWRMRAALAAALFAEPDLLLLDEPTNHLDLEANLWLAAFLARWPRTLLICGHDRALIDMAATETVHLHRGRTRLYRGGWSAFVRARRESLARDAAERERIKAERRRMQAFVDRFRYKATKARQAQSRLKTLEKLAAPPPPLAEAPVRLRFPEPLPLAPPLLDLQGVAVGYDAGRPVLRGLDLRLDMGDRVALLGANGNGKTTLLRLLAGRLRPSAGALRRAPRLAVGYFAQDRAESLDPAASAERHVAAAWPEADETARRAHCGRFGLSGALADTPAAALSGGETVRLVLALICCARPQLLLLDEPTDHLDMDSREALVAALADYEGAAILVSHDEDTIMRAADRLWLVADGGCRPFDGDLDDYRALTLRRRSGESRSRRGGDARRVERRRAAAARTAAAPLRRAAHAAEAKAAALGAEIATLEAKIADPALYGGEDAVARAADLNRRRAAAVRALAAAEAEWLAAEEALERADKS